MKTQFFSPTSSFPVANSADICTDIVHLKKKEFTSRKNRGEEMHLKCLSGIVWITQPGDLEDYILNANESLKIDRKGMAVVQAMSEAVVCW